MAITEKDIHKTADDLVAQNISPTLENVRDALGGGSYTKISKIMKIWRTEQAKKEVLAGIKEPAPERVSRAASEFAKNVWEEAQALATERLNSEREALETARKEYEERTQEATDVADKIANDLEVAKNEIASLEAIKDELNAKNEAIKDELNAEKIENAKLSSKINELEKEKKSNSEKQVFEIMKKLDAFQAQLDNMRKERDSQS